MNAFDDYFGFLTDYATSSAEEDYDSSEATEFFVKEFKKRDVGSLIKNMIEEHGADFSFDDFCACFNRDNVNRWLKNYPISRDKAFELTVCFGLSVKDAEIFVRKQCAHEWIYWRDYHDDIYYFFLKNQHSLGIHGIEAVNEYRKIQCDFSSVYAKHIDNLIDEPSTKPATLKRQRFEAALNPLSNEEYNNLTQRCHDLIENCKSTDDLLAFLNNNIALFGEFNRKAYRHFVEEIEIWKSNRKAAGESDSLEALTGELRIQFDEIEKDQNSIKNNRFLGELLSNNPDRQWISATLHHKKPVQRKHLLLLLLLNENDDCLPEDVCPNDDNLDLIEERRMKVNSILYDCGMPLLDAFQPFDWIILNSMALISNNGDGCSHVSDIILSLIKKIDWRNK